MSRSKRKEFSSAAASGGGPSGPLRTAAPLVRRHLLAGWIGLLVFLSAGIALEALHALKAEYYLDLRNSTRRLMWTLGHAHGTLLSLVSIALAWTASQATAGPLLRGASRGVMGGLILLPLGFFAGGLSVEGGDPGLGILLVPVGACLLLAGVLCAALALWVEHAETGSATGSGDAAPSPPAPRRSP